jgi:hypothetical protein
MPGLAGLLHNSSTPLASLSPTAGGDMAREMVIEEQSGNGNGAVVDTRAARILARTFYKDLRENGYTPNQILALSTELIDLVTRDLRGEREKGAEVEA